MPTLTNGPDSKPSRHLSLIKSTFTSTPQFKPASLSSFEPISDLEDLDLVTELADNKDRYKSPLADCSTIGIRSFPDLLSINLERIQKRVTTTSVSRNSIIACCLRFSLSSLFQDDRIKDLMVIRKRYAMLGSDIPTEVNTFLYHFINSFSVSLPKGPRYNAIVSRDYHNMLTGLSGEIGMSSSNLAVMGIMIVLADQQYCNKGDRKTMDQLVNSFFMGAIARARAGQALLSAYGL